MPPESTNNNPIITPNSRSPLETSGGAVDKGHFTEFCNKETPQGFNDSIVQSSPTESQSVAVPVLFLFSIGNMVNGLGGTSFYIAGVTYADDNVKKENSAMYHGILIVALYHDSMQLGDK